MLDEIQHTVDQHDGLQHLLQLDGPDLTIAHVKSSLGMARDIDKNIEDATEACNITVCQTLGEAMHNMLPRELRDMVYEHLTGGKVRLTVDHGPNEICATRYEPSHIHGPYFATSPRSPTDTLCADHFWRDSALGPDLARELMENWYRTTTFEIGSDDAGTKPSYARTLLSRHLSQDRFKSGFRPQTLVSKIECCINILSVTDLDDDEWRTVVLAELTDLSMLKNKAHVQVTIWVPTIWSRSEDTHPTLLECLGIIRPALLRLRKLEYRMRVEATLRDWWVKMDFASQFLQAIAAEVKES
jgi:hypothetical protein